MTRRRIRSLTAETLHRRFLHDFDDELDRLLRENPDRAERINDLCIEIFEMLADGLRKRKRRKKA